MSSIKKLFGQTAIYGLSSIIGRMVPWMLTPVYTKLLPKAEYGLFSDLYVIITYFLVILSFGMETTFFRYSHEDLYKDKAFDHAQSFVMATAFGFLLIFGLSYQWTANLGIIGYAGRENLILYAILIVFLDVIAALPMAKLRFDQLPIVFAGISLISIFLNVGLNLYFIWFQGEQNADFIFLSNLIASSAKLVLISLIAFSPKGIKKWISSKVGGALTLRILPSSFSIDKTLIKKMAGYGFFIMLAGLFGMINQNGDVNFIKRLWGSEAQLFGSELLNGDEMAGLYAANKKLAIIILLVIQAFRYAAEPFYFRHFKENNSKAIFARAFHYFMLAAILCFVLVSSFSYEFVSTKIFGYQIINEAYWQGLEIVPWLLFAFVLWGGYVNISIWFKITTQVRFGLMFSGIGTAITAILSIILIPLVGYYGSIIAILSCYGVMITMVYVIGQKYFPVPYNIGKTGIYLLLGILVVWVNVSFGQEVIFSGIFWKKMCICTVYGLILLYFEKYKKSSPPPKPAQ